MLIAFCLILTLIVGCSKQSEEDKVEEYTKEVMDLVASKGYTVEEIAALQHGQKVEKIYDNEVLERFGKVLVYEYLIQSQYTDTVRGTRHDTGDLYEQEVDINREEVRTSILAPEEFQKEQEGYYDNADNVPTITNMGYYIVDAFYESDEGTKRSYFCIVDPTASSFAIVGNDAPLYMESTKVKEILSSPENENKWYRIISDEMTGTITGKQLIFPLVLESK